MAYYIKNNENNITYQSELTPHPAFGMITAEAVKLTCSACMP